VDQAGQRIRAEYPMSTVWQKSPTVHVGASADAPPTAVVAYDPQSGVLTALRRGVAQLSVRVNGVSSTHTVTVR
jgi:hypothetical protein